ncbi:MAG TPA: AIR synthase-related protein, partial [Sphingomicrobium sp.]|nr:AIR synthase-related protein [Sphingomicrobium sp.]
TKLDDGTSQAILPTPAIGGVGLLEDWEKSATIGFKAEGETILVIGGTVGHLGQSLWLSEIHARRDGPPPPADLIEERANGEFVRALVSAGLVTAVHDVSDGGLAVAVAEMALAGGLGARIAAAVDGCPTAAMAFGEDQGRYVVTTRDPDAILARAGRADRFAAPIGVTGGESIIGRLDQGPEWRVALADLCAAHEGFFPNLMGAEGVLA